MQIEKELEMRKEHRLINSKDEESKQDTHKEKQRSSDEVEEVNKPSFLGEKDRTIKNEN